MLPGMDRGSKRDLSQQLGDEDDPILPQAQRRTKTKQQLTRGRTDHEQEEAQRRTYVPRKVWDFIDWQLRYHNSELLDKWGVEVRGQAMDSTTFRKKMNRAVKATDQSLRNNARTRPPSPELPSDWQVWFHPLILFIEVFRTYDMPGFYWTILWESSPPMTEDFRYWVPPSVEDVSEFSVSTHSRSEEETPLSEESQEVNPPTASAANVCGISITSKGSAAPIVDAMSIDGRCSWNPRNELFQSRQPQSYDFMKSPAVSYRQQPSVNPKRSSAIEMLSFSMRSMQL